MAELGEDLRRQLKRLRFEGALEEEYQEHATRERRTRLRLTLAFFILVLSVPSLISLAKGDPASGAAKVGKDVAAAMDTLLTVVGPIALLSMTFHKAYVRHVLNLVVTWGLLAQFWFHIANRSSEPAPPQIALVICMLHAMLATLIVAALRAPALSSLIYGLATWGWSVYTFLGREPLAKADMVTVGGLQFFLFLVAFLVVGAYFNEFTDRRGFLYQKLLHEERERLEMVLGNVLPAPIAERLKRSDEVIAEYFPSATVLFADIVDFTPFSRDRQPGEVVGFLNEVFSRFDALVEAAGLEKIKTVGDAYMVAGGLPEARERHLQAIADLALEMRGVATALGVTMRIGLHSGPVVAGVIGTKKYLYDLWGDTVNTASRMEAFGLPGEIQMLSSLADSLGPEYQIAPRGPVDVKGLGVVETSLLIRKKVGSLLKDFPTGVLAPEPASS